MRRLLLFCLLFLPGCGQAGEAPGVNQWRYTLNIPAGFKPQAVQGIDSSVAAYKGPGVELSMDHGMYGGAPACAPNAGGCQLAEEQLDGHRAVIGRYRFRPDEEQGRSPFSVDVYVQLRRHPTEEGLNMRAHCTTQRACDRALAIFRTVRFHRR